MMSRSRLAALGLVVAAAAWLWRAEVVREAPAPSQLPDAAAGTGEPAAAEPANPASAAASSPRLELPPADNALAATEVVDALTELLGRKAVTMFLQTDDFAQRLVATVDNLGRDHAPARLWPVNPTPERLQVRDENGRTVLAPDNGQRYTPLVLLVETVSVPRAVDLYLRLYPELQARYEELGYPGSYFNDRLLAVVDLLLATPEVPAPIELRLMAVQGPIPSERPWTRYEFADPALQSLSAGQKLLLRTGEVNARRLKAKLAEFRAELLARAVAR